MVPIVYNTVIATATAGFVRCVTCEGCGKEYVFNVERTEVGKATCYYGVGAGRAERAARDAATHKVTENLKSDIRAIPCPSCGWYQAHMVEELRDRLPRALGTESMSLFLAGGGLAAAGAFGAWQVRVAPKHVQQEKHAFETWAGVGVFGLLLLLLGGVIAVRNAIRRGELSPNEKLPLDERLERGRAKAMLHEEFARANPGAEVVRNSVPNRSEY